MRRLIDWLVDVMILIRALNALMFLLLLYVLGYGFYSVVGPVVSALAAVALAVAALWQFNNSPKR